MEKWTPYFEELLQDILAELQVYVEMETPTHDKESVDRLGQYIASRFQALGCQVEMVPQQSIGNQYVVTYGHGERPILLLGHFDTVKYVGTLATEPWKVDGDCAFGPGVFDMKSGIVFAYFALRAIVEHALPLHRPLVFFWNTDEETGSASSAATIQTLSAQSECVLVLEPAHGDGLLKTSRKSGGEYLVRTYGRAAHAGNDHHLGVNAILEMAHQIQKMESWTNYETGTTVSVGLIRGGTASNVIPDYAEAVVDVRVARSSEVKLLHERFRSLVPVHPGSRIEVTGGIDKPPLERTEGTERLFELAQRCSQMEGFSLGEIGVGGTSDGNIAAVTGTPVLDGLGAVGDGAHATHEHILISHIPARIALLVQLLTRLP